MYGSYNVHIHYTTIYMQRNTYKQLQKQTVIEFMSFVSKEIQNNRSRENRDIFFTLNVNN